MSFQIERGLFLLDFTDYHAILGIPVDADIKDIRKRYLKIARRLHPDSCISESESDKQRASQLLSKLVNPAWEKLSQEKDCTEYGLLLKLKGQQALQKRESLELVSSLAKQLATTNNPDHFYQASLKDLANKQYDYLDQTLELTAQISELNLVYLMRKESSGGLALDEPKKTIYTGSNIPDSTQTSTRSTATAPSPPPKRESFSDQYYRRAEALAEKGNFAQAILELRDALKIEPNNSRCHSLLGVIHLRQNQLPMARVHINKALQIDPQNEMALAVKQKLEQGQSGTGKAASTTGGAKTTPKASPKPNKPNDQSGGGLFGLFGGKKK
ncbi:MAG: J domain-containing protein [Leptolyngbyaceae cyanobacterium HOT.MB2.61]|nr:J domain-containing protein [Leptolyngbyaceae cyanobacterium HOT.MB2.61]